eukprot:TRINITY_DN38337_c0_g1_i3.p1 TRINITY_DN38337_c0_g1~~TRINITY_DN38337_c0_g1_i3.p1  ORF type:complete len:177 (-),score=49.97 TRINITY_DN38337_c0_g1_i3:144-674(-)
MERSPESLARQVFDDLDLNGDGVLDRQEFAKAYGSELAPGTEDIDFGGVMSKIGDILQSFDGDGPNGEVQRPEDDPEADDQFIANITAQIRNIMSDRGDSKSVDPSPPPSEEEQGAPSHSSRAALAAGLSARLQHQPQTLSARDAWEGGPDGYQQAGAGVEGPHSAQLTHLSLIHI